MYYIVRTNQYIGAFYHARQRGVVRRIYQKGRWQAEQVLVENCKGNFTVHYENELTYLFCQDSQGDIILITINDADGKVNRRIVLKSPSADFLQVLLYPILTERSLIIIYNAAGAEDRNYCLMTRRLDESGQWTPAVQIDTYWPDNFEVQRVTNDHLLLFYQTRTPDNNLGYREITPNKQGDYRVYYSTKYHVSDLSRLTTDDGVHTLFVVKSMFSSQLIYRRNVTGSFSNPLVLYESQRIEDCLLFFVHGNLYITFLSSGGLYICMSGDKGASFSQPVRYRGKFCQSPEKAFFISSLTQSENGIFLRHVYVDRSSPWDIQIIPEMFEEFFPAYPEPVTEETRVRDSPDMEHTDEVQRLKNQIELLEKRADEKDGQIISLSRMLAERNRELAEAMSTRREKASIEKEKDAGMNNSR